MKKVGILMGSASDMPVAVKAIDVLEELGVPCEVHILSAHKTPEEARGFALAAESNGFGVLIGMAGMAAHLAGALAACSPLPVIGVPVKSGPMEGMDALLATVMMPPGMPVATVGVDSALNAGILAAQIVALGDEELGKRIVAYRKKKADKLLEDDKNVDEIIAKCRK